MSLEQWRRDRLDLAATRGEVVALTGLNSIATPSRATTPTGMPIEACGTCERRHPVAREHCTECGRPSLFLDSLGLCVQHAVGAV